MKNFTICLIAICFAIQAKSQVLYLQTFDGIAGPTSGGAGTYVFPADMLLRNVDNRTPNATVAYVNEAWERREDLNNVTDSCAMSTSWYNPIGAADDFMWTPAIAIPITSGGATLNWNALAYDPLFLDGYEVRIMIVPNTPTGGTGALGNQVANSTQVFTIAAENSSWTNRSLNLNPYIGQSIYIGFRNNSNDKFLLAIDDIKVESIVSFDAATTLATTSEYTQIPLGQGSIPLGGTIQNVGTSTLTNLSLVA
jgi:hypothetical protein